MIAPEWLHLSANHLAFNVEHDLQVVFKFASIHLLVRFSRSAVAMAGTIPELEPSRLSPRDEASFRLLRLIEQNPNSTHAIQIVPITITITWSPRAILHFNNHDSATRRASDGSPPLGIRCASSQVSHWPRCGSSGCRRCILSRIAVAAASVTTSPYRLTSRGVNASGMGPQLVRVLLPKYESIMS